MNNKCRKLYKRHLLFKPKRKKETEKEKSQSCHVSTINLFMVVTISSIFYVIGEVLYAVHTGFFTDVDTVLKIIHVDL